MDKNPNQTQQPSDTQIPDLSSLMGTTPGESVQTSTGDDSTIPSSSSPSPKKPGKNGLLLVVVLFLVLSVPVIGFMINTQRQIADNRNFAAIEEPGPYEATPTPGNCTANGTNTPNPAACCSGSSTPVANGIVKCCAPDGVFSPSDAQCCSGVRNSANLCGLNSPTFPPSPTFVPTHTPRPNVTNSPSPTPPAVCQGGTGTPDADKVIYCTCANGCSLKNDPVENGGGGTGWVCEQNCRLITKAQLAAEAKPQCWQADYAINGATGPGGTYCGVLDVTSCQKPECQTNVQPTSPPITNVPPTATPITGQCQNVKIYKDGVLVTTNNLNSLKPGNQVVIGVVGTNGTKARIRVNGGEYMESSTKSLAGEFTFNYTIPTVNAATTFTLEAELLIGGTWR